MDVVIITGASKGIGYEFYTQFLTQGKKVIGLARTAPKDAQDFVTLDLADTDQLEQVMKQMIEQNLSGATSFTLINNAGMVSPIGLIGSVNPTEMATAIAVNLTAPMILCNTFIAQLQDFKGRKQILNISSGAGRNAYEGWGAYCTTKAGLDHFTRVIALEQKTAVYPVEIVAMAPGIIDTGMQETIRGSEAGEFPLLDQFIDYKEQGLLSSAEETAEKLIAVLTDEDFNAVGPTADIRQI